MYQPSYNCFRQDLIIVPITKTGDSNQYFLIKDSSSGETFEFGEEEFFLCTFMDGKLTSEQIISKFEERFNLELTLDGFAEFSTSIVECGLLEVYQPPEPLAAVPLPDQGNESQTLAIVSTEQQNTKLEKKESPSISPVPNSPSSRPAKKKSQQSQWMLFHPNLLFKFLAVLFQPFSIGVWFLIPGVILAFFTLVNNQFILRMDLENRGEGISFFSTLISSIILVNLGSKIAQGIVFTAYGGIVEELGIQLTFGFFPLFYISQPGIKDLNRQQKLWVYATPLLFRLSLIMWGLLIWHWTRGTGTQLRVFALIIAQGSLVGLLLDVTPLWNSNGYLWLTTYFRFPRLYDRAMRLFDMIVQRRPLPKNLSSKEKFALQVYAVVLFLSWAGLFIVFTTLTAVILETNFQGTGVVLFGVLLTGIIRWYLTMTNQSNSLKTNQLRPSEPSDLIPKPKKNAQPGNPIVKFFQKNGLLILGVAGCVVIASLPYNYRPGGPIKLLPPKQKEIQADISGKITNVFFKGGDGQWIKQGTLIAQVEPSRQLNPATPTKDDALVLDEQIKNQEAQVQKQKAQLNQLLATPRKEEVDVAESALKTAEQELEAEKKQLQVAEAELEASKRQLQVAFEDVETARKKLETAEVNTGFREREATRLKELYEDGAISLQDYEDAARLSSTSETEVEEQKQNVQVKLKVVEEEKQNVRVKSKLVEEAQQNIKTKLQNIEEKKANLNLVLSGVHPDQIAAAKQDLEASKAKLKEIQQELKNTENQLQQSDLVMPFEGRLITPYLDQKIGTYLEQGNTFAVAEDDRNIRSEVEIPETDVGEFKVGAIAEVKLSAYPNDIILGKVISIEPTAIEKPNGKFVKVIVELPNSQRLLKSGMSGYAKIEGTTMPVILAFSRPVVRFFQIEVWSWIP